MKVYHVHYSRDPLSGLSEIGDRLYSNESYLRIEVVTDIGTLTYEMLESWVTDLRSGGKLADLFVPYKGSALNVCGWLVHDANFGYIVVQPQIDIAPSIEHPLTFDLSNELLDAMQEFAGLAKWQRNLMTKAVSSHIGKASYDRANSLDKRNAKYVKFRWTA